MNRNPTIGALLLLAATACSDVEGEGDGHDHDHDHNHGLSTSLVLELTPRSGGDVLTFAWSDPENDGDPVIDDVVLADGETYDLGLAVWNELEDPAEDVTVEISDGAEEHQFFFTGDAVRGPATGDNPDAIVEHAYADTDANGAPIGIDNTLAAIAAGSGALVVTLRHIPPEDGNDVKTDRLAADVAVGGLGSIPGENDIQVEFPVTVE
jgi:hypothetical protein